MAEPVIFVKGTGKTNKSAYLVGTEKVPAAVITRLLTSLQDLAGLQARSCFLPGLGEIS